MKKILFLYLLLPLFLYAKNIDQNLEYSGYIKTEVWLKNNLDSKHQSLSMFKNTFDIGIEYKISDRLTFFFHPRYFYDFAYDLREDEFDRTQEYMGHTQRTDWLRDCYLDYNSDNLDIRLGKQQVVWGHMDIPILDKVMPFDLSNWFLPDLADMRIPLWMLNLEYSPFINSVLQFLIIPDFEANRVAPPGAPFSFSSYNAFYELYKSLPKYLGPAGGGLSLYLENIYVENILPAKKFKNSTFGVSWRSMIADLEYTLNWLYGYSYSSYLYEDARTQRVVPPRILISSYRSRRHKRIQLTGFSFAKTFVEENILQGITLKGEFAFIADEPTYYGEPGNRKYTEVSDKYNWGLALEKNIVKNLTASFQFLQFITDKKTFRSYPVLDPATYGVIDKVENSFVLKLMTDFLHERLKPEITLLYSDDNHGRIVPKITFELTDNWWLKLGYAHFYGRADASNGQFRNNDQIMFEVKYTF